MASYAHPEVLVDTSWLKGNLGNENLRIAEVDYDPTTNYNLGHIPGSVLIPKGEFLNGNALAQLPSDKQIVMHCKSGVRSAETLAIVAYLQPVSRPEIARIRGVSAESATATRSSTFSLRVAAMRSPGRSNSAASPAR